MEDKYYFVLFALLCSGAHVDSLWTCSLDQDCTSLSGSICNSGACECRPGQQAVRGGRECVDISPYLESPCVEDHQCARLFSGYHCLSSGGNNTGICFCQEGYHYFHGRCWKSLEFGDSCTRSEECLGIIRDPFSLTCNGVCQCAEGYIERQRGECRRVTLASGGGCVLDQDCQFPNGACNQETFTCVESAPTQMNTDTEFADKIHTSIKMAANSNKMAAQRTICDSSVPCPSPFECSAFGVCVCPSGYYESTNGQICYADLGSPSTAEQCVGLLAEVIDGVCSCRPNFFYDHNMRDCIRVTRRIQDSCVSDVHCHTFGTPARCGPPKDPWGIRNCECIPETSVWDENRQICRLFAGIGEACEVDSDCLAGTLEIRCVLNDEGAGFCACPEDLNEVDGLCLSSGLELGDPCQSTLECTATNNTICNGVCSCAEGYQAVDDFCAPIIGGSCTLDSDCLIENTICVNTTTGNICQCIETFVEYNDICWPGIPGFNSSCFVTAQCAAVLGVGSICADNKCTCIENYHHRDGGCWPITGLFERCERSSQCYLEGSNDKLVCRNSFCECDFKYPYAPELGTCLPSKASAVSACAVLILTAISMIIR
nr:prion-like-(Q/N-rich) domain-bearing protein 25 [Vanessa tameamea]